MSFLYKEEFIATTVLTSSPVIKKLTLTTENGEKTQQAFMFHFTLIDSKVHFLLNIYILSNKAR